MKWRLRKHLFAARDGRSGRIMAESTSAPAPVRVTHPGVLHGPCHHRKLCQCIARRRLKRLKQYKQSFHIRIIPKICILGFNEKTIRRIIFLIESTLSNISKISSEVNINMLIINIKLFEKKSKLF